MEIEESTFRLCKSLTRIHMPKQLYEIKGTAFGGCTGLQHIYIPEECRLEKIASDAFEGVTAMVHYPTELAGADWIGGQYGGNLTWIAQ